MTHELINSCLENKGTVCINKVELDDFFWKNTCILF